MKIVGIVEGHGEVNSLRILLSRLAEWRSGLAHVDMDKPIRVARDRFLNREEEFQRYLQLAADKCGDEGRILILLDADDDCPATLAPEISLRAKTIIPYRQISVVLANREYEAWFIAAAASLDGVRDFKFDPNDNVDPESSRDAKGWIGKRKRNRSYSEILDQPAMTSRMDLEMVFEKSRSFRKLCKEWDSWSDTASCQRNDLRLR